MKMILDVGCGHQPRTSEGRLLTDREIENSDNVNIDSLTMQKERESYNYLDGYGIKHLSIIKKMKFFVKATGECLPFKDEIFDEIICWGVLEHILSPSNALHEMHRVLKKNGRIFFMLPNATIQGERPDHITHLYSWSPTSIGHLLLRVGFKMVDLKKNIGDNTNMEIIVEK